MLRYLLDGEPLEGPHAVHLRLRPRRFARVIPTANLEYLIESILLECQIWGGAATPLIPVTVEGRVDPLYASWLLGTDIDGVIGVRRGDSRIPRSTAIIEVADRPEPAYGVQFAPVTTISARDGARAEVTSPVLAAGDPWRGIYAACLGMLPSHPDPLVLSRGRYREDLRYDELIDLTEEPVTGSFEDLADRLSEVGTRAYPRAASMNRLAYGRAANAGIRVAGPEGPLSQRRFWAFDAGPNIVVICTAGDVRDHSLLWNLRVSHGDANGMPIGVLAESFSPAQLEMLLDSTLKAPEGIPYRQLYVTSVSIDVADLRLAWERYNGQAGGGSRERVKFLDAHELVDIGPAPGRHRTEVAMWADGKTSVIPITAEDRSAWSWPGSRDVELSYDLDVLDSPFPQDPQVRAGTFPEFFAGTLTANASGAHSSPSHVEWPTRWTMAKVIAHQRRLDVLPSEPGTACMTFLRAIGGVSELSYLAHEPLLALLDEMAQRMGTAWAKAASRSGWLFEPRVAPTIDDLPDVGFDNFRVALGVRTPQARAWMRWAERRRVVVKGFPLTCERCQARQWVPVGAYRPPIVCVGCAEQMKHPFPKEQISFTYRLGEAARRVYEHDAMGHLLTLRYLAKLLHGAPGSRIVGAHPGVDFFPRGIQRRIGEADVLLLDRDGGLVPVEVKRTFAGATDDELARLDLLADSMDAPWDAVAVNQYASKAPEGWLDRVRARGGGRPRVVLTYEQLLDPAPFWSMGSSPFDAAPASVEDLADRGRRFGELCDSLTPPTRRSRLEEDLLRDLGDDEEDEAEDHAGHVSNDGAQADGLSD